jgi:anti-anti-sigma regulatory factor
MDGLEIARLDGLVSGFRLSGHLDASTVDGLQQVLARQVSAYPIVLEMSGVRVADRAGLRWVLRLSTYNDGPPTLVIRNPSPAVWRALEECAPDGAPGLEVRFDGVGPGAAHRLTFLANSTMRLLGAVGRNHERARRNLRNARELRGASASLRAMRRRAA